MANEHASNQFEINLSGVFGLLSDRILDRNIFNGVSALRTGVPPGDLSKKIQGHKIISKISTIVQKNTSI